MAGGDSAKADQIAFHIYTKLFHVLHAARASDQGPPSGKTDKWFNLETPLAASGITPTAELDVYRALSAFSTSTSSASQSASSSSLSTASNKSSPSSSSAGPPPPLAIQVLLAVPPPGGGTALVHAASGTRVEPEPRFVLLEEWALAFSPTTSTSSAASTASGASTATTGGGGSSSSSGGSTNDEVLPPTIYKNAIPLFRALYALLRILPAWRAGRKLAGRRGGGQAQNVGNSRLRVVVRVRDESSQSETQARATGGRQTQTTMNTGVMGGVGRGMGGGGGNGGMGGGNGGNGGNGGGTDTILAFGASPAPGSGAPPLPTSTHVFPGVPHPAGTLTLSATYLTTPVFTLASLEALLSSRFAVLDARPGGAGGYTNDNSGYNNDNIYNNNTRSSTNAYASSSSSFPNTDTRESGAGTNSRPARTPLRPGLDTRGAGAGTDAYGARSPHARGASEAYGGGRGSRDAEEDEDAEFVPTLARRSITTSSASLGVGGAGMSSSPGRQTVPLPGAGVSGSPGRYGELGRYTTNEAGRYAPTAEHGQGRYASESGRYTSLPGVGPTTPLPGASGSPGRYVSALQQQHGRQRSESTTSPSPAPSYRMGVHVASGSGVGAGYRRDVGAAGGGDVVDRFVLPRSGASSLSAQSSLGAGPGPSSLGGMRGSPSESAGMGGEHGRAPSEREREREREKGVPIGGAGGGFGAGIGTSASGSGGGLSGSPATTPSPLAINPFKSNTLSRSSLSGSLLRGVAGSPGRAMSPIAAGSGAGGAGMGGVAFPMPPPGPSGDSAAGSLGGGTPGSVGAPGGVGIPMRKRYSSSFPHRYGAAAGSSVGSGGSGESGSASGSMGPAARERTASAAGSRSGSFQLKTSPAVDEQHDDISSFVKDIDAARPLLGRYREAQQQQQDDSTRDTDDRPPSRTSGSGSNSPGTSRGGSSIGTALGAHTITPSAFDRPVLGPGGGGAMLTSESEVDERLRRMNEEFMRSLVGLGGATANSTGTRASSSGAGGGSGSGLGSGLTHSPVSGRSGGDGQGSDEVIGRLEFDFDASPQFPL